MAEISQTSLLYNDLKAPVAPASDSGLSDLADNLVGDFWGEDGFSFGDILDMINPLQQLPIIGTLYRAATGEAMSIGSTILGGGLFGGIIGAGAAVVNTVIEEVTGSKIGEHVMALFDGEDGTGDGGDGGDTVLAASQSGFSAYQGRLAQEATMTELAAHGVGTEDESAPTVAGLMPTRTLYPDQGRWAQEATMTDLAARAATQTAPAPAVRTAAPANPVAEAPVNVSSAEPARLSATPSMADGGGAQAAGYISSEAGLQIARALGQLPDKAASFGNADLLRSAIDRYSRRTSAEAASKALATKPVILDSLL